MTPERHSQIQRIFEAAVDLSGARRDSYLDQACAGDADLRARIRKLLAADEQETETVAAVKVCAICSRCYDSAAAECDTDGGVLEFAFPGALLIDGKYRIERRLGHGGMGAVYLVCHTGLEKRFALKLILSGATVIGWYRKSFEIEARALGRLKHPHIVGVTDYGIDPRSGGVPYLVMEYLEGETLRQVLRKRHYLPLSEALPLLRSIGDAIDFAHDQGIIHGDLKPAICFSYARRPRNPRSRSSISDWRASRALPAIPAADEAAASRATLLSRLPLPAHAARRLTWLPSCSGVKPPLNRATGSPLARSLTKS